MTEHDFYGEYLDEEAFDDIPPEKLLLWELDDILDTVIAQIFVMKQILADLEDRSGEF